MKIYVFDVDGNLLIIPTKFYMQNIKTGKVIVCEAGDSGRIISNMDKLDLTFYISETYSMRNFRGKLGDARLYKDIKKATNGPSWNDFVECINSGSFFGIITGRGNSPACLRKIIMDMIEENRDGLNVKSFVEHIKTNTVFIQKETEEKIKTYSEKEILDIYLNKYCFFYAKNSKETMTSLGLKRTTSMAEAKLIALKDFERKMEKNIEGIFIDEVVDLGFSDDEDSNCKIIENYFKNNKHPILRRRVYGTSSGKRILYKYFE